MTTNEPLPRALEILWGDAPAARRTRGLSRDRIVAAAIELVEAEGLGALSMARLAERLGCGTMSLYRHVANKDEVVRFMLSGGVGDVHLAAPPAPPPPARRSIGLAWRAYRLGRRAVGCVSPAPVGPADRRGWPAGGSGTAGVALCRARRIGRHRPVRTGQAGGGHGGTALRPRRGRVGHRGCRRRWPGLPRSASTAVGRRTVPGAGGRRRGWGVRRRRRRSSRRVPLGARPAARRHRRESRQRAKKLRPRAAITSAVARSPDTVASLAGCHRHWLPQARASQCPHRSRIKWDNAG